MTPDEDAGPAQANLESALDAALSQVQRSIVANMKTIHGVSARPDLEKLEHDLKVQREQALKHGRIDRDWLDGARATRDNPSRVPMRLL